MRKNGLPEQYIVIKTSDEEFAICLDSLANEESPVYGIEIPFNGSVNKIGDDFNSYIKDVLDESIEIIDEDLD